MEEGEGIMVVEENRMNDLGNKKVKMIVVEEVMEEMIRIGIDERER